MSAHVAIEGEPSLGQAESIGRQVEVAIGEAFTIAHATLELESITVDGRRADCEPDIERLVPR